jgi:hypothetical protein
MKAAVKKYWMRLLNVGLLPDMDETQQMRLFVVNAFLSISLILTIAFIVTFVTLGLTLRYKG